MLQIYWISLESEDEMYAAIFRLLPGGRLAKAIQFALIVLGFVALLFFGVFPFIETLIPEDPSLNG